MIFPKYQADRQADRQTDRETEKQREYKQSRSKISVVLLSHKTGVKT